MTVFVEITYTDLHVHRDGAGVCGSSVDQVHDQDVAGRRLVVQRRRRRLQHTGVHIRELELACYVISATNAVGDRATIGVTACR